MKVLLSLTRLLAEPLTVFGDVRKALGDGNIRFLDARKHRQAMDANGSNADALFIWIPKSAGTSISAAFESAGGQRLLSTEEIETYFKQRGLVTFGHLHIPALIDAGLISHDFLSKAYKFTIVRNPFDRAVSLFEYLKQMQYIPETTRFDLFCGYLEAEAWEKVGLINHDGLSQLNPQVKWLTDKTGKMFVDDIYRFETLAESWPEIWRKAGIETPAPDLPQLNRSKRNDAKKYYSDKTVEIVQKVYQNDFELLEYSTKPYWT